VAFDLDGTLYVEDEPVAGASGVVASVRAMGAEVVFVTNASGRTRAQIAARLTDLGMAADCSEVITSASAAARWTRAQGIDAAWVTGAPGLVTELEEAGVRVTTEPDDAAAVVVGLDRSGRQLEEAAPLPEMVAQRVRRGDCLLVACNRDTTFPGRGGIVHPGCGEVVRRAEAQCGRVADAVLGKPEPYMLEWAAKERGISARELLVVGDSWTSDVGMAVRCGSPWALVPTPGQRPGLAPAEYVTDPRGTVLESITGVPALVSRWGMA
jgi:HAD superfamily hydrolase (TIGR01450 family)